MNRNLYNRPLLLVLIFWLPFSIFSGFAQTTTEDVIYLKNGSVIRGVILEQKQGEYVKIETYSRNIWVFMADEIKKITREEVQLKKESSESEKDHGYLNITDMGLLIGKGELTKDAPFSFHTINGYRFRNQISTGLGIGIEFLETSYMPLFGDLRYHLIRSEISPYLYLQFGYNFPLENEDGDYYDVNNKGGLMFNPGIGVRFNINRGTAIILSVSYRYQELKSILSNYWPQEETNRYEYLHRFCIRFGFVFD